jgi:hypothetical protein
MWCEIITATSSCENIRDAKVLMRISEEDEGLFIVLESVVRADDMVNFWIEERIGVSCYKQARDIIAKLDGVSACNFLDRQIESWGLFESYEAQASQ